MKKLPPEREQEYREAWKTHTGGELSKMFNISEKTVTNTNKRLGLQKGLKDDSGKPFKQYVRRKDAYPVGTIVTHHSKANGELKFIINEQGERIALRVHNWLKAGRPLPKGRKIFYIDPNRENRDEVDNLITKEQRISSRKKRSRGKAARIEKPGKVPKKKIAAKTPPVKITRTLQEVRFKRPEKVLPTKQVDTSKLIPVRIDHKTIVYAKSEADISRIKELYSKKVS